MSEGGRRGGGQGGGGFTNLLGSRFTSNPQRSRSRDLIANSGSKEAIWIYEAFLAEGNHVKSSLQAQNMIF